jgi:dihydrofolate synthase/folylpolyglutamate synthase
MQVLPGRPTLVLDAAHNPHAAAALASALSTMGFHPETYAVFAALADKDVEGIAQALAGTFSRWFIGTLAGARAQTAESLRARLIAAGVAADAIEVHTDIAHALAAARSRAGEADRIVAFGSFLTLAAARAALAQSNATPGISVT